MVVLAPWRHYGERNEIAGWREHDAKAEYPIYRIELLRPLEESAPITRLHSLWRLLSIDLPLKLKVFNEVRKIVRRHAIRTICVGELVSGSWVGLLSQRLLRCKMISYIHGEEITTQTTYRFFGRQRRRYLQRADAVVAVSQFTKTALVRQMGVDAAKIRLIHNGVDVERFQPGPKRPDLIERHGLAGKRVILSVGRIVPRKGFDVVIRAMPRVMEHVPDVHYVIVGGGHFQKRLETLVGEQGLASSVTFAGQVPDSELADYYRLCDLFVMPNREMPDGDTEGFGLVFLEANACGKPVIGGIAGGAVEAVRDGENGLLVDGWSVTEVSKAIILLMNDSALHQRISEKGLAIAQASSSRVKANEFQRLCRELEENST
jgi:phosphatidylinositol alpha-1,6-mannosyltransferase